MKSDTLILIAAAGAAAFIVTRATRATTPAAIGGSSYGTGSPENVYSGRTLSQQEAWQAANREQLKRELASAGDFYI